MTSSLRCIEGVTITLSTQPMQRSDGCHEHFFWSKFKSIMLLKISKKHMQ